MSKRVLVTLTDEENEIIEAIAKKEFRHRIATTVRELAFEAIANRKNKNVEKKDSRHEKIEKNRATSGNESMVS